MVRRRVSAVSNHEAIGGACNLRDAASRLLRMRVKELGFLASDGLASPIKTNNERPTSGLHRERQP
jgi:hypothetical protein